jgi:acetolactate synthase-1/2/3 large subunit
MIRVADYIVKFLVDKGINNIFLLPGGASMFLNDAVALNKDMKYTAVHHEQTTAMAAEGFARYTGKLGVAMVTAGPGATNTITGVAGAFIDSVPIMVISGQSKTKQTVRNSGIKNFRQMGAQEVDIIPIVEPITKYSVMVADPKSIKYHLEKAYKTAMEGRKGPVWLDIPIDIQSSLIDENSLEGYTEGKHENVNNLNDIKNVYNLIMNSKRPVILAGNGIRSSNSLDVFYKLIDKLNIPVVTTRLSMDVLPEDDRLYTGRVGIRGNRAGNFAMQNCDLLISLGSRMCIPVTGYDYDEFAREAKVVMVDIDDAELNKNTVKIDCPIKMDLNKFIKGLLQVSEDRTNSNNQWVEKCSYWKEKYPTCLNEYWNEKDFINSYCLVDKISENLNDGDVILSDAGSAVDVAYHAIKIKSNQRVLLSGGLASMGHSLPASIGVAVNNSNRTICVTGDGSLQMNIQELAVLGCNKLNTKVFILNNSGYLTIRGAQYNHFEGRLIGEGPKSGLGFPDFELIAKAYGLKYVRINVNSELDEKVKEVLDAEGPVLCDVNIFERQLTAPKQSSKAMPDGRVVSAPLEDMAPFLDRDEFFNEMIVEPWSDK